MILADTAKRFNLKDTTKPLLIHPVLGVGYEAHRHRAADRISHTAAPCGCKGPHTGDTVGELRVLYVAMTRAREKLIITAAFTGRR